MAGKKKDSLQGQLLRKTFSKAPQDYDPVYRKTEFNAPGYHSKPDGSGPAVEKDKAKKRAIARGDAPFFKHTTKGK